MSVPSPHPKAPKPYRYGVAERLYLPLFVGLWVTLKHFVRNLLAGGGKTTIQYPEQRRAYSHRFRGHHILTSRPDGSRMASITTLAQKRVPSLRSRQASASKRPSRSAMARLRAGSPRLRSSSV